MIWRISIALLMGLAWTTLTPEISLGSFAVGTLLGFAVLTVLFQNEEAPKLTWHLVPQQALAAVQYTLILFHDIYFSAFDVAKRVVQPTLPINPGIIATATQYTPNVEHGPQGEGIADVIAAISAHGITITPGELVVDFNGNQIIYVHCLDVLASTAVAESNQAKRMRYLRRIFP